MTSLAGTPSAGQSEVLRTIHDWGGGGHNGIIYDRLAVRVSHFFHGSDDSGEGGDAQWQTDVLTAVNALATAGYIAGVSPVDGSSVDLTGAAPASGTLVVLTTTGIPYARHPRPRAVAAR